MIRDRIDGILRYGTLASTLCLVGSVLLQIFARFFLEQTPPWTEEASRLFFIYATAFAAGLAMRDRYYVHLDVFFNALPKQMQAVITIAIPFLIALLFILVFMYSLPFVWAGREEMSPSMHIPMGLAFASMSVLGLGITFYALSDLVKQLKAWRS